MRRMLWLFIVVIVGALAVPSAAAAAERLSTTDRLDDRRYTAIGDRAYVVGFESGEFYAQGWHIKGEMGGFWSQPVKLLDGLWLGINGEWIGPATRFTSGYGHVRMRLPDTDGLKLRRIEFAPDGERGVLVGLRIENPGAARTVSVQMDAHSELMSPYPWGWTTPTAQAFNLADTAQFDGDALLFREQGKPHENAEAHDWGAAVGASITPTAGETGDGYFGPDTAPVACPALDAGIWTEPCKDSPNGKGKGGRLTWTLNLAEGARRTLWIGVAGSEAGTAGALSELEQLLDAPRAALRAKIAERERLAGHTKLSLPGDPLLAEGIDWSKQNLADSVQVAEDLELRDVNEGKAYPAPLGELGHARWLGAGWPDYPWLFGTDGEFTAFASVAVGQFEPIMDHLRALRDVSEVANKGSGKVVHEVVHDGSIYFGMNDHAGNTDETAKFPSAVALLWRWTGSKAWLDEMYPFARKNVEYIFREIDDDGDGWPEGLGNVERTGMGPEKLDNTVSTIRALWDLADMAHARGDRPTQTWALQRAGRLTDAFDGAWWMPEVPQYADSLSETNERLLARHWIGVTPMEIDLARPGGAVIPGLAPYEHGVQALETREEPCYSNELGLFHTGRPGCDGGLASPSELAIYTLNTAVMAVGEGNYGRLGADQQRRFTDANRQLQLPTPDEQPGSMPELAQYATGERNIDRPHTERSMVLQAWGAYGTAWPVVHQQLGVRPDLGRGRLAVVPQLPSAATIGGDDIRLGGGSVDVQAGRDGATYRTTVDTGAVSLRRLEIGHTLPRGATVASATLDGQPVAVEQRLTNRGLEVTTITTPGSHTFTVTAG
jgi:hypothetical protein